MGTDGAKRSSVPRPPTYGAVGSHARRPVAPPRPPPEGLGRVSSQPSFVPYLHVDFDAVAERVQAEVGAQYSAEELLLSLATPEGGDGDGDGDGGGGGGGGGGDGVDVHAHAEGEATQFEVSAGPEGVLSIRPPEAEGAHAEERGHGVRDGADDAHIPDEGGGTSGFAVGVPLMPWEETEDDHDDRKSAAWSIMGALTPVSISGTFFPESEYDEEEALIPRDVGLDMTCHTPSSCRTPGSALLQRFGPRDVAEDQEILFAMPKEEQESSAHTGMLFPILGSKDDLQQLVVIVPPTGEADGADAHGSFSPAPPGPPAAREYLENITNRIPPMLEVNSSLALHGTTENATVAVNVSAQVSWVGYAILFVALLSVASQGTAVKFLPSVGGMIAASWLMQTQALLMVPFCVFQLATMTHKEYERLRDPLTLRLLVAASVAQVCWASGFFLAIDYTSLFHAWSLNNVHALSIVVIAASKVALGVRGAAVVSKGERQGAVIAICGVLLMQIPALVSGNLTVLVGDLIATASSLGAIWFLHLCKELRSIVPLFVMMTPISALNAVLFSVASAALSGTDFSVSDNGALGWLNHDRLALGLYLGGVVGFLGTVSCIAALKFLPSVIVGSVQTMMPVLGTILAIAAGVDTLPDFSTTLGGAVLLWGVLLIADATRKSEHTVVINDQISAV